MTGQASGSRALDRLVGEAKERITRFVPADAAAASERGGLIIDIRSQQAREARGVIPGSLHIPRTVLEWRVAAGSRWRNPYVGGLDEQLILICDHGYSSVLAASNLVQIGFHRAGDVIGGFEGWVRDGLPVLGPQHRASEPDVLPGMRGPDQDASMPGLRCRQIGDNRH